MMDYILFTYPNCQKCDELKRSLHGSGLQGEEFSLTQKESKRKIRDYLQDLNRDQKGGIIIPTLILLEENDVTAVLNKPEELEDWLKSRA